MVVQAGLTISINQVAPAISKVSSMTTTSMKTGKGTASRCAAIPSKACWGAAHVQQVQKPDIVLALTEESMEMYSS